MKGIIRRIPSTSVTQQTGISRTTLAQITNRPIGTMNSIQTTSPTKSVASFYKRDNSATAFYAGVTRTSTGCRGCGK